MEYWAYNRRKWQNLRCSVFSCIFWQAENARHIDFVLPLMVLGIMGVLLMKEPDLGTSIVTAGAVFMMMFIGGTPNLSGGIGGFSCSCLSLSGFVR